MMLKAFCWLGTVLSTALGALELTRHCVYTGQEKPSLERPTGRTHTPV